MRRIAILVAILITLVAVDLMRNQPKRQLLTLLNLAQRGRDLSDVETAFREMGFVVEGGTYFALADYYSADPGMHPRGHISPETLQEAYQSCPWECRIVVAHRSEDVRFLVLPRRHTYRYVVVAEDGVVTFRFEDHSDWLWMF